MMLLLKIKINKNYYSCYSIACKDDDLIATEIHQSVLRICVDLIEFPKKKKKNSET